jgi:CheY-like chemotaxis protein
VVHRILVVHDAAVVRESLATLLQEEGYAVVTADDGYAALLAVAGGQASPNLTLLDLQMPCRSGWEVLAVLQTAGRPLPVIGLSLDPAAAATFCAALATAGRSPAARSPWTRTCCRPRT